MSSALKHSSESHSNGSSPIPRGTCAPFSAMDVTTFSWPCHSQQQTEREMLHPHSSPAITT
eukprot:3183491-Amphidinium_carterae.1